MTLNENAVLYYSKEYDTFSCSIGGKTKEGEKYNCFIAVSLPNKEQKNLLVKKLDAHESRAVKVIIKKGFMGCFKTKKGEVLPQAVIQEFEIEEFYKDRSK